jgi:S-DNA-T family DNA segregation ATPase FtsK/SpoIIIE
VTRSRRSAAGHRSSRGQGPASGGSSSASREREAAGVLLVALGLFLGVAFVPDRGGRQNLVGPLGESSFDLLHGLFSWGGLAVPVLALVWGVTLFRGSGAAAARRFSLVTGVGTLACLTALALVGAPSRSVDAQGAAGLVPALLGARLQAAFGFAGALIALGLGVLLALIFGVESRPSLVGARGSATASVLKRVLRALGWTLGLLAAAVVWLATWVGGLLGVLGVAFGAAWTRLSEARAARLERPPETAAEALARGAAREAPADPRRPSPQGFGVPGAGAPEIAARVAGAAPVGGIPRGQDADETASTVAGGKRLERGNGAPPRGPVRAAKPGPPPAWEVPLELFDAPVPRDAAASRRELQELGVVLIKKLADFNVRGEITGISSGPVITQFEVEPAPGVKVNQIANLADDLALAMRAQRIRIVAPIPGRGAVGIEIPNARPETVTIRELLASRAFTESRGTLPIILGKEISGTPVVSDLTRMPHLLIAGSTGSGKSVCINALLTSLLYRFSPADLRLILIDPKMLELSMYNEVPHLLHPVVTRAKDSAIALKWAVYEMERRFELLARNAVRNVADFNARLRAGTELAGVDSKLGTADEPLRPLPYVVVVVDELADLMLTVQAEIEEPLARLAQKARAVGIHVVLATQRPSVNVLTGFIKANFPSRISFQVASKTDSRTILDQNGAEALLGQGDMLFLPADRAAPVRIQGAFVSARETEALVECARRLAERHEFAARETIDLQKVEGAELEETDGDRDELFFEAARVVIEHDQGSTSLLQRRLKVGYSRAARIVDQLHQRGILGPPDGSKPREVRIGLEELAEMQAGPARSAEPRASSPGGGPA